MVLDTSLLVQVILNIIKAAYRREYVRDIHNLPTVKKIDYIWPVNRFYELNNFAFSFLQVKKFGAATSYSEKCLEIY